MVITSPLTRKASMPLLSQAFFIGLDQFGNIVEGFDNVTPIRFSAVFGLVCKVLDGQSFTFSNCLLFYKVVNLKGLVFVSVTFHKDRRGLLWMEVLKQFFN